MNIEQLKNTKLFAVLRESYLRHSLQANIGNAFSALPSIKGDEKLREMEERQATFTMFADGGTGKGGYGANLNEAKSVD
jgi:hypothetical protein